MGTLYDHKLNNRDMRALIAAGETVIHQGRCIRDVNELPSDVVLAGDDIVKRQHALGELKAQKDALDKQITDAEAVDVGAELAQRSAKR